MSTFAERSGGAARIRITPIAQGPPPGGATGPAVIYNIKRWSVDEEAEKGDTSNTESQGDGGGLGIVAREQISVATQVRVKIEAASYDPTLNFWGTPMPIPMGGYILLELFPDPVGAPASEYIFPIFWVEKRHWEGEAGGLQPLSLEGLSNGGWTDPF